MLLVMLGIVLTIVLVYAGIALLINLGIVAGHIIGALITAWERLRAVRQRPRR